MSIDRAAVEHVARLARLALTDDELDRMSEELSVILAHAEKIQALDLDGIEPTAHGIGLANVLRPDDVSPSLDQEEALQNAPSSEDGRFKVPRIVEDA